MTDNFDTEEMFGGGEVQDDLLPKKRKNGRKRKEYRGVADPAGVRMYGEDFTVFQLVDEYEDLIPRFKEFFYEEKIRDENAGRRDILQMFNATIREEGRKFHPNQTTIYKWMEKWEWDIKKKKRESVAITTEKYIKPVVPTREIVPVESGDYSPDTLLPAEKFDYSVPAYAQLEDALQTFGGELVNDAMTQLRDDQQLEELYDSDELMKRKTYALNVFSHVTKMVHSKAALLLKTSEEKRNNASFLMDLMKKSTAGTMTVSEIQALKATYSPLVKQEEHVIN